MKSFEIQCLDYIQIAFENEIQLPIHSKIEFKENGKIHYHLKGKDIIVGRIIKPHRYIDYLTVFMMFDAFLERQIPGLIEIDSYDKRLSCLPEISKSDKVQKNFYRYIIIIRNAIVHHLEEINDLGDSIFIEFLFGEKKNSLKLKYDSLHAIISYIAYRIKNEIINEFYFELYIEEYYNMALRGIENCIYKGSTFSRKVSESDSFYLNRNYVFIKNENEAMEIKNKLKEITLLNKTDLVYQTDNKQYIIPGIKFCRIEEMKESNGFRFV